MIDQIRTHLGMIVLLGAVVLIEGCSHQPPMKAPHPRKIPGADQGIMIREAQREAQNLRSELAASKIANAKQAAALRASQHEAADLRTREKDLALTVGQVQEELSGTRAERDQLRRQNAELQTRSTALPHLQQLTADIKAMQTSLNQMVTTMKSLMTDVTQIKQDIRKNRSKLREQNSKLTAFAVTKDPEHSSSSTPDMTVIRVKAGDTLWRISQTYATSVDRLKKLNGLESNLLKVGQPLRVPVQSTVPATPPSTMNPKGTIHQNGEKEPAALHSNDTPADMNEES